MSTRLNVAVECVVDARNTTGESPLWSERDAALYWVDIPEGRIFRWQPETGDRRTWQLPTAVGSNGCRLDADERCTRMAGGVEVANGLAWSADGLTMYHSDYRGTAIFRYDYDPETGSIGRREVFSSMLPEWGRPDGGATDEEGCYW